MFLWQSVFVAVIIKMFVVMHLNLTHYHPDHVCRGDLIWYIQIDGLSLKLVKI